MEEVAYAGACLGRTPTDHKLLFPGALSIKPWILQKLGMCSPVDSENNSNSEDMHP